MSSAFYYSWSVLIKQKVSRYGISLLRHKCLVRHYQIWKVSGINNYFKLIGIWISIHDWFCYRTTRFKNKMMYQIGSMTNLWSKSFRQIRRHLMSKPSEYWWAKTKIVQFWTIFLKCCLTIKIFRLILFKCMI